MVTQMEKLEDRPRFLAVHPTVEILVRTQTDGRRQGGQFGN